MPPTFSVIVPCYRYGHLLAGAVGSALSQLGVEVDVLIIDDCSPDGTPEVAEVLARDPRVSYRRHARNTGHLQTYNEGLAWASGDFTVLLSADDRLTPGALVRAADAFLRFPSAGFVYGHPLFFESDDRMPRPRVGEPEAHLWRGWDWIERRCRTATNCISSPEVVVRTDLQQTVGGYRADLPHSGDLEMWLRLAAHADVVYLKGVDQAHYRVHNASMARTTFADPLVDLRQRKAAFDAAFALLPGSAELAPVVARSLASEALREAGRILLRSPEQQDAVAGLEGFAAEVYPGVRATPGYLDLRWRRAAGSWLHPALPPVVVRRLLDRAHSELWWRRWRISGV